MKVWTRPAEDLEFRVLGQGLSFFGDGLEVVLSRLLSILQGPLQSRWCRSRSFVTLCR